MTAFGSPVRQGKFFAPVTQVSSKLHVDELLKTFSVQIRVVVQCLRAGQHVCDAGVEEIKFSGFDRFAFFGFGPSGQKKAD